MTYALLGSGLGALAAVMTLALLLYKAQRETMHAGDLLNAERSLSRQYQSERDVEVAAHAVTSAQLREAQQRLASAEAQRNEVKRREAERLKESDVHTVADVLTSALGNDWGSVHGVSPLPGTGSASPDRDDLEKP